MSDRRPHWTDDLIEAVYAELPAKAYQVEPDSWEVHRIIAAVEDWVLSAPIFDLYLSRKHAPDKAAIERVRELCKQPLFSGATAWVRVEDIEQALDGADSPPLRGEVVAELNGDLLLRIIKANRDNPHRPCDCGSRAPNCEVCDERWPCTDATVAQVLAKPYLNARPYGQPDPWREGYNQALREVRDTLMDGNHE